jgi:hypothetical protein
MESLCRLKAIFEPNTEGVIRCAVQMFWRLRGALGHEYTRATSTRHADALEWVKYADPNSTLPAESCDDRPACLSTLRNHAPISLTISTLRLTQSLSLFVFGPARQTVHPVLVRIRLILALLSASAVRISTMVRVVGCVDAINIKPRVLEDGQHAHCIQPARTGPDAYDCGSPVIGFPSAGFLKGSAGD